MKQQNISCSIEVNISPRQAIGGIGDVRGWWATNVKGNTSNLNDVFTVRFGKTFSTIKITEVIPDRKIVWYVVDCDLPLFRNSTEWKDTEIVWDISASGKGTRITMTHVGLTPDLSCYSDCEQGWSFYVKESLSNLLSGNKGFPGTGIFANIIQEGRRYEGLIYFKDDPLPEYPDGFIWIDVKSTDGERVTAIYSAAEYRKESFKAGELKGDYFMIVGNKPVFENIKPVDDILKMAIQ